MYVRIGRKKKVPRARHVRACVCPGLRDLFVPSTALRRPRRAHMSASWGARDLPVEPDRQRWTGGAG